jgi:hypothetical protein
MTIGDEDVNADEPADLQEVRAAYRELPPPLPGIELDARVRAAVATELAGGATGRVVPLRRWRRVALPLATAATVIVAVSLWQLQGHHDVQSVAVVHDAPVLLEMPPPPATAQDSLQRPSANRAPPREQELSTPMRSRAERSAAPAQLAAKRTEDHEPVLLEIPPAKVAKPATAPAPQAVGALADLARTTANEPQAADELTFAEIRRLLAAHRRDEARTLLQQWRAAHLQSQVPKDLQALLDDAAR